MLSDRIRQMGGAHWLALFALVLVAWALLQAMALPQGLREGAALFGAEFWRSFCTVTPDAAGYLRLVAMWALMGVAMMAPTALPAFATYDDLSRAAPGARFSALVAGYIAVWLGFALLAAALQLALTRAGLLDVLGASRSALLTATLLAGAGLYQFSALKEACLSRCRQPMTFFMQHWDEGAFRNGLRLGADCLGCCWALMLLALVGGVMNLGFMGLAMVLMTLEKLPAIGRYTTWPLGVALLAAAGVTVLNEMTTKGMG